MWNLGTSLPGKGRLFAGNRMEIGDQKKRGGKEKKGKKGKEKKEKKKRKKTPENLQKTGQITR